MRLAIPGRGSAASPPLGPRPPPPPPPEPRAEQRWGLDRDKTACAVSCRTFSQRADPNILRLGASIHGPSRPVLTQLLPCYSLFVQNAKSERR